MRHPMSLATLARTCLTLAALLTANCSGEWISPSPTGPTILLSISNTTTGEYLDPDGYQIIVDGQDRGGFAINANLTLDLFAGHHTVQLIGVARNCEMSEAQQQSVVLTAGHAAQLRFTVFCAFPAELARLRLIIATDQELYSIHADGSGRTELAQGDFRQLSGSPDGREIAFSRQGQIYIIKADGTGLRQVTTAGGAGPAWSPDGSQLVFTGTDGALYIMPALGGESRRVTNPVGEESDDRPQWSPDGQRIAFTRFDLDNALTVIWVVSPNDGAGIRLARRVGNASYPIWNPVWSPDGSRIACLGSLDGWTVFVMSPTDDQSATPIFSSDTSHFIHAIHGWSRDGSWMAVTQAPKSQFAYLPDIYLVAVDGKVAPVRVTSDSRSQWAVLIQQ